MNTDWLVTVWRLFTPQNWAIIIAVGLHATAALVFLIWFFSSRWWREMVVSPVTGKVVAGDFGKSSSLILGHTLTVAVVVANLGFSRSADAGVIALIGALYTYSGVLQNVSRLKAKDLADAANPAPKVEVKDSEVNINTEQPKQEILAGYNDGIGSTTQGPTFKN